MFPCLCWALQHSSTLAGLMDMPSSSRLIPSISTHSCSYLLSLTCLLNAYDMPSVREGSEPITAGETDACDEVLEPRRGLVW